MELSSREGAPSGRSVRNALDAQRATLSDDGGGKWRRRHVSNVGTELLLRPQGPYLRLRDEDLAARPGEAVERIVRLDTAPSSQGAAVKEPVELPFVDARTVMLAPTHSIKGNPDRMQTGPVEVRLDDRWQREMRPGHRRLVTALTWPLLARYGYLGG